MAENTSGDGGPEREEETSETNGEAALPDSLAEALEAARRSPGDRGAWERLEEVAAESQRPDEVSELYQEVLARDLSAHQASTVGKRAARFLEEWFGEESPALLEVLDRVLELDPSSEWAFQRLSVVYTVAGRWDDLLRQYDAAIASATEAERREALLDEAADIAKDLAGLPDRAIGYLQQLIDFRPADGQLSSSLERLLERQDRWEDLISFWGRDLDAAPAEEGLAARLRIATCYFDRLEKPERALDVLEELVGEGVSSDDVMALLERISESESAPAETRRGALGLLKRRYEAENRSGDVVRTLDTALALAGHEESISLHREAGQRLMSQEQFEDALEHYATLLSLEPTAVDARQRLQLLGSRTGAHERVVEAFENAAGMCEAAAVRISLRLEAAELRRALLEDTAGAVSLYRTILEEPEADDAAVLGACRRLQEMLEAEDRKEELLEIVEILGDKEPEAKERMAALGRAARLADALGKPGRALSLWGRRAAADEGDVEALDATISILEREKDWEQLVEALRRRSAAPVSQAQRRADVVRVAWVQAEQLGSLASAVETWREVQETFGEDQQSVDALSDLLSRAERWDELYSLLDGAAEREGKHVASVLVRLGDAYREHGDAGDKALEFYGRALRIEPRREEALAGLRSLMQDDALRGDAAEALADAFEATDGWTEVVSLLDIRVESASDLRQKVRVLWDTAEAQERHLDDARGALDTFGRALELAPEWDSLEAELLRVAAATGGWDEAAEALRDAAEAAESPARTLHLRSVEARLQEEHLEDTASAAEAWGAAFAIEPGRFDLAEAVVRTAAQAGRWDRVAVSVITHVRAVGDVAAELVDTIDEVADATNGWGAVTGALDGALGAVEDLDSDLANELDRALARWLEEERNDHAGAEVALRRAVGRGAEDDDTLRALARLQRQSPGPELYSTLMKLSEWSCLEDDIDPLVEAATLAAEHLEDADLEREALERLHREATRLWRRGASATGSESADEASLRAIDRLGSMCEEAGEHEQAFSLLADGARLPVAAEVALDMRRRAARLAAGPLEDRARTIMLYKSILEDAPDDEEAIVELAAVFQAEGRLEELLPLRHHELKLCEDTERRLELRLDIARIIRHLEVSGGRLEALQANLSERPGHSQSIDALFDMFNEAARYGELAEMLTEQAERLQEQDEGPRAADLWAKVAVVSERKLDDVDRALHAHRKVLELASSADALAALARLHEARGEHAAAARWLERLLKVTEGQGRVAVAYDLGRARLAAGQREEAVATLEEALAEAPGSQEVRTLLAEQYRDTEHWEPLADLLTGAAPYLTDTSALRASAVEAAEIYGRLGMSDRSIEVLERAGEALPEDQQIKRMLATGFIAAERVEEARGMLEQLIAHFGRRRNAERAAVHLQLARVLRAEGDLDGALEELDQAAGMDVRNTQVMELLGEMAREAGQLDRAEKAFRALLMVVRRQPPEGVDEVGPSEVLYELHLLTNERGHEDQAEELLMSALQIASQSSDEACRFKRAMLDRKRPELLLKALDLRVECAEAGEELSAALADKAEVLDRHLDQAEEALDARLAALAEAPDSDRNHEETRALARRLDGTERYIEELTTRIARARRQEESHLSGRLLMRLGAVYEEDVEDMDKAADAFGRAEELLEDPVDAQRAMIRVAGARGDVSEERRLLATIIDKESVPSEARMEARYRLGEVLLGASDTAAEGLEVLEGALGDDPLYDRAGEILRVATTAAPEDSARLALYGRVARAGEEPALLLDYLEKRAPQDDATLEEMQEATRIAEELEAEDRLEPLLERAAAIAEASEGGLSSALWAAKGLAERRKAAGDLSGALKWMRSAAESASDEDQSRTLWLEAAALAVEEGDADAAAELYDSLLEKDPSDRRVWEPLLDLLCTMGDEERVAALVSATVEQLMEPAERNAVRLRLAGFILGLDGRESDAAEVLRAVIDEEPDHKEAGSMLADLFERIGFDEDLTELLRRQMEGACEQEDEEAIHDLALRLGAQLEKVSREEAMDVYRRALEPLPDDRDVASRLLALFGPEDDQRERVQLMERPLQKEEGEAAAKLAVQLADEWGELDDYDGVRRVLRIGHQLCPEDDALRDRLEEGYRSHEEWEPLAALWEAEAGRLDEATGSVELLRKAAHVHRENRKDLSSAAEALVKARGYLPADVALLEELVSVRSEAGARDKAIEEVAEALDAVDEDDGSRSDLLALRAELRMAEGQGAEAVEDLEAAFAIAGPRLASKLADGLDKQRLAARGEGEMDAERVATLRLVEVLRDGGEQGKARDTLADWLERSDADKESLYLLRGIDEAEERWDDVAHTCERLVGLEEGDEQVAAALALADAWGKVGTPESARAGLERVFELQPGVDVVRERLAKLYEEVGATKELATMVVAEARAANDDDQSFDLLRRAGDLFLQSDGGETLALEPLQEAANLRPDDHDTTVLLVDGYIAAGHHAEAVGVLEHAIAGRGNRRSPQLAELQHRMARLAEAAGDKQVQLQWLNVALDSDRRNGYVAADLAYLAMELGDYDTALKALRVVTVGRSESPMSRAQAFLMQGRIAHAKGEQGPALAWARRAASEDPELTEAEDFIAELGG